LKAEISPIIERPRICSIDLEDNVNNFLKSTGANIYEGTLGAKIKVPNNRKSDSCQLLLNFNFPPNLHEYDIIIIDLDNYKTIDYKPNDHTKTNHTGRTAFSILSSYPETLFDPRPVSSHILKSHLDKITNRKYLVIVFSCKAYDVEYEMVNISEGYPERQALEKYNIFSFWNEIPSSESKFGKEIKIEEMRADLQGLFEKHKSETTYHQTFYKPKKWIDGKYIENENYFPLLSNMNGDIISFMEFNEKANLIVLPQIKDKKSFLPDFLYKIAPSIYPNLFPFSTTFKWKEQEEYWLPKHAFLLEEQNNLKKEFENKLAENEKKIQNNISHFSFLHEIITETGETLVKSLIHFLKWLEFTNVEDFDNIRDKSKVLEEDIQIQFPDKLLIIECKGIGGTSTDSDCSQISKIKHRRCREREKFDVFALYIVNHQRFLPPLKRQNPPFTPNQLQDAIDDERGLLSTWQLYNLYFEIENGVLTKEEARASLFDFGLIEFKPKDIIFIYEPTEFFGNGQICVIQLESIILSVNEELYIENNGKYEKVKILGIQDNGNTLSEASKGEIGLKLNKKIGKKTKLWKKAITKG